MIVKYIAETYALRVAGDPNIIKERYTGRVIVVITPTTNKELNKSHLAKCWETLI